MTLKLYIGGPLFTPYHCAFHARNAARLRREGFICLVPQERSIAHAMEWDSGTPRTGNGIFDMDYEMIAEANALVVLLDDADISSGLACEIGLFWTMMQQDASKKGILGLLTDDRAYRRAANGSPPLNALVMGCILGVGRIYRSIDEISLHLHRWAEVCDMREHGMIR